MKQSNICSKCGAADVVQVPGTTATEPTNGIPMGLTILSAIPVTRYICTNCGFCEEWIDSKEDLQRIKKKYKQ